MSGPSELSVLWREGTFLCPQHFQAFSRELHSRISAGDAAGTVGPYGLAELTVDEEALERDVFVVDSATLILRDGSLVSLPKNASIDSREFASLFTGPELRVYMGVPAVQPNVPQISSGGERMTRYDVESVPVFDENARDSSRAVEFRQLRARLFFEGEDQSGFECLPIAKLVRRGRPEARSALSTDYIPPLIACRGSRVLVQGLTEIADRVRAQARDLAARMPSTESFSAVQKGADITGFLKLYAVNGSAATLQQLAGLVEMHPLHAYLGLVRVVGDLAIFSPDRVPPDLPVYDHEGIDRCFESAFEAIRSLLVAEVSVPYDTASFVKSDKEGFLECRVPADWCRGNTAFYLGVELARSPDEVAGEVLNGVKLVAADDVDRVIVGVIPGVALEYRRVPPLSFPKRPNLHFFEVQTEGEARDAWMRVLETRVAVIISSIGLFEEVKCDFFVELHS